MGDEVAGADPGILEGGGGVPPSPCERRRRMVCASLRREPILSSRRWMPVFRIHYVQYENCVGPYSDSCHTIPRPLYCVRHDLSIRSAEIYLSMTFLISLITPTQVHLTLTEHNFFLFILFIYPIRPSPTMLYLGSAGIRRGARRVRPLINPPVGWVEVGWGCYLPSVDMILFRYYLSDSDRGHSW